MNVKQAYKLGLDYAKYGANEINCNFTIFSKKEYKDAWEKGYKEWNAVVGDEK